MRKQNWPQALNDYIESRRKAVFCWGAHDCILFAAGAIEVMTGANPAPKITWKDAKGAARVLKRYGGIEAALTGVLGEPIPIAMAGRGDVVLRDGAAGICLGTHGAWIGENGLAFEPISGTTMAWKVK